MVRLTPTTLNLVSRLQKARTTKAWFFRTHQQKTIRNLLLRLGAAGEAAALPCVARFLSDSSTEIQQTARSIVRTLLSQVSSCELMHVGELLSSPYHWGTADSWGNIVPSEIAGIAGNPEEDGHVAVLGLMTFHRNGYVRHEAVRQLSTLFDGTEFRFLLIRQNDWVEAITKDAQAAVAARLVDAKIQFLENSLKAIFHLASLRRYDHGETIRRTVDIVLREGNDSALRRIVNSPSRTVRRQIVRLGLAKAGDHRRRLVSYGLESDDAVIRLSCCRYLFLVYESERLTEALNRLLEDRFMPVRREAIRQKARRFPDAAPEVWMQALLDRSRSIRELACWHVTKTVRTLPRVFYRAAVQGTPKSLAALEGLSETADESDLAFFRHLLKHPLPSRRCVALRGLVRIGMESLVNEVLPLLLDDSPSVVRAVCSAIGPYLEVVPRNELFTAAMDGRLLIARHRAVGILADMDKWDSLPWLLKIASEAREDTAAHAEQIIRKVCARNSVFTTPSQLSRQKITRELERSANSVAEEVLALVKSELNRFG